MVGGNFVVGFAIFLILVIVQFMVITKGSERVAEVAARFTLDAMPGKQMSIDADLNSGLITESEARARRRAVEREADFYGSMDGASKFVKGDAIASIIITLINLIGGFAVGVGQKGLDISQALTRYTLLTVGDGLVSQIPALLISTATGIIITRAASENNLGQELTTQMLSSRRVLYTAGVIIAFMGLVPGLPTLPFLTIAGLCGAMGYFTGPALVTTEEQQKAEEEAAAESSGPEKLVSLLQMDPLNWRSTTVSSP